MTIVLSAEEYQSIIATGRIATQEEGEIKINYSHTLGPINRWSFKPRPELKLAVETQYYYQPIILQQSEREHPIEFTFHLQGNCKESVFNFDRAGESGVFGSGICPQGQLAYPAQEQLLSIDLHLDPNYFSDLIGQGNYSSNLVKTLIRENNQWLYANCSQINPNIEILLKQIINCPYDSYLKRLYLESKILDLITLRLEQFSERPEGTSSKIRPSERDRVYEAKDILDQCLEKAPTLAELSRQVGLNERKLKQGFQDIFATSVFAYLRDRRLEKARELLTNPENSVQEVASAIGYASRSQFANAFRNKFGVNPKSYQLHL